MTMDKQRIMNISLEKCGIKFWMCRNSQLELKEDSEEKSAIRLVETYSAQLLRKYPQSWVLKQESYRHLRLPP